jgi:hypothetical protein
VSDEDGGAAAKWTPHLWALIVPVLAVVITYAMWFLVLAILRLPDFPAWLSRLLHAKR